jgi:hypothetical protein
VSFEEEILNAKDAKLTRKARKREVKDQKYLTKTALLGGEKLIFFCDFCVTFASFAFRKLFLSAQ